MLCSVAAASLMSACEPSIADKELGATINPNDIKVRVENPGGSNKLTFINETPGTVLHISYLIGYTVINEPGASVDVVMPFVGDIPVQVTALSAGGQATVDVPVTITQIDAPIDSWWTMLAGSDIDGKKWVWAGTANDWCDGGYGTTMLGGGWSGLTGEAMPVDKDSYMIFDLNGNANYTKYAADGSVISKTTFAFNKQERDGGGDMAGTVWSVGTLSLPGASILNSFPRWGGDEFFGDYYIQELTDTTLILAHATTPDAEYGTWAGGTFWTFKAVE